MHETATHDQARTLNHYATLLRPILCDSPARSDSTGAAKGLLFRERKTRTTAVAQTTLPDDPVDSHNCIVNDVVT